MLIFWSLWISLPGGCAIGQRPVDLHLSYGANGCKNRDFTWIHKSNCTSCGLKGAKIVFSIKLLVGGTEQLWQLPLPHGTTTIINAAKEPEIVQLCEVIASAGVKIEGIGDWKIIIEGTGEKLLDIKPFDVFSYIEAGHIHVCSSNYESKTKNW